MEAGTVIFFALFCVYLGLGFLAVLTFAISSSLEKESYAAQRAYAVSSGLLFLGIIVFLFRNQQWLQQVAAVLGLITTLIAVYLLIPVNKPKTTGTAGLFKGKVERIDERDNIWARARTMHPDREDREEYKTYYTELHPERKKRDDELFATEVGHKGSKIDRINNHNKAIGAVAINRFMTKVGTPDFRMPSGLYKKEYAHNLSPEQLTELIKGICKHLGADIVGIAELKQEWVYSKRGQILQGNWQDWGKEIELDHKYVISFGFGMDVDLVRAAPYSPEDIEVYYQYWKAVVISSQVAWILDSLGYEARAHHLRGQDLVLPPIAVDCGLGQVSRCNSLLTEKFGTRVRLGAVTTNAPLIVDQPVDIGVDEFCGKCGKCARLCPLGAIPEGERKVVNGSLRWDNDPEKCYEYWQKIGTHCSICLSCCPWSHASNFVHDAMKYLAIRCYKLHPLMIWADDFFYGKNLKPRLGPKWLDIRTSISNRKEAMVGNDTPQNPSM